MPRDQDDHVRSPRCFVHLSILLRFHNALNALPFRVSAEVPPTASHRSNGSLALLFSDQQKVFQIFLTCSFPF